MIGDPRLTPAARVEVPTDWLPPGMQPCDRYEFRIGNVVVAEGLIAGYRLTRETAHLDLTAPLP